ncbi:GGDEF domain-containing protein [Psychromonas sp. SP041]|uniref:GGDEF domain-containing protein n=1 Tax=Psychromonas sp. SP041 TaxID=1365007 RepID=UPI0010C7D286|nr:GGDEF domain-containing protein [Psychromonas sp. SP041]
MTANNLIAEKYSEPKPGVILKGIFELLESIRKNVPSLNQSINLALNKCLQSIKSGETADFYSILSLMAKDINKKMSEESLVTEDVFITLSSKLSLFENQLLGEKEKELLISIQRKVKSKESSIKDGMLAMAEMLNDISDNSKALTSRIFGEQKLKDGIFYEGTEKVLQADLAVATRRLGRDLDRLSATLSQQYPNDDEITTLRGKAIEVKSSESTKFFEAMDVLSRITWAIHRINSNRISQDKEELTSLANAFKQFATGLSKTKSFNDEISEEISAFESDFEMQIKDIQNVGNNATSISEMKARLMANVEKMQKRTIEFTSKQQSLLDEQSKVIKNQSKIIDSTNLKLDEASKELVSVKSQTSIDSLSGLGNRRCYDDTMAGIQRQWREPENNKNFGLILIDIDFFKKINDTHGHQVGDEVIKWLGKILNVIKVKNSKLKSYRYGGEEFAIISDNATPSLLMSTARWLHKFLQEKVFTTCGITLNITVSIGVSFFIEKDDTHQSVFFHADKALYRAKNSGRNRIWVSRSKEIESKLGPLITKKS